MSKIKKEANRVWREKLDRDGYTSNGAYYGVGAPLYGAQCVECGRYYYVRAANYSAACRLLSDDRVHMHYARTIPQPLVKLKVSERAMPAHWACYLINGDGSGMSDNELSAVQEVESELANRGWRVVSADGEPFNATFRGLFTEMLNYTLHKKQ